MKRRDFITAGFASSVAFGSGPLMLRAGNQQPETNIVAKTSPSEIRRSRAKLDLDLVFAFVRAGHADLNRVKEMVGQEPALVLAAWDWGGGDWETALGGASHVGRREIATYLLEQGARIDAFCAAMLGERDVLKALLVMNPSVATTKGPHGYTLLYHAAIGGDVAIAEAIKPLLPPNAKDYNQALSAAARDGRLEMAKWLLENGVTDPNVPDGFNKTALMFAVEKKFPKIESELRGHGAHEKTK